jgi:acyl-CoA synthetase (AMP-forming)/AMP-acid ligase II
VVKSIAHAALIPSARADANAAGACLEGPDARLDNATFAAAVETASRQLVAAGIGTTDVVAAMMRNRIEFVLLMFACWRVGAVLTPLNPGLTADEAAYQLDDSGARMVIADLACADRVVDHPLVFEPEFLRASSGAEAPAASADPNALALLIYTSGTTGRPKGVMLSHANLIAMARMWADWLAVTPAERCLLILPLFHVNGIMVSVVGPLLAGGSVVIGPRFDPTDFWRVVERVRPTYFSAVPTIVSALLALPESERPDASSLRFVACGGAPATAALLRGFECRYGAPVIEGYGLSECTVAATINPLDGARKPGTVGVPLPGQEVKVVDPAGASLPDGEAGEVLIKGPNVMLGYLNRPEATAETLRDGWLRSGDVGYFDQDGYLVLSDRIKDLIIWAGENISAKEVEEVLLSHAVVMQASVVGREHPHYGEEPVAFVALAPGAEAEAEELLEHCRGRLAKFKLPREIWIEDELPTNAVGKLVKGPLRERSRIRG